MIVLNFKTDAAPDVAVGHMKCFVVMTRNKDGYESVFPAYYLNAYALTYENPCGTDDCKAGKHEDDGCPTTGWFSDQSDFEYDNCYHRISADVVAWSALPSPDEVKTAIAA